MKRKALALLAGLLLIGLVPGSVLAITPGATLDQSQDVVTGGSTRTGAWSGHISAQTFTVGHTGQLTDVGLLLGADRSETLDVSIQAVTGSDAPSGISLATGSAPGCARGGLGCFFSPPAPPLRA